MSLAGRIASMMHRPNDDLVTKDEVPSWQKYLARVLGTVGGVVGIIFGVLDIFLNVFSLNGIFAALLAIAVSFCVLVFEAPLSIVFIGFVQEASNWMDNRPYWNKAICYLIGFVVPLLFKFDFTLFFALFLILCTGIVYGVMSVGKKGISAEMGSGTSNQQVPPATVA